MDSEDLKKYREVLEKEAREIEDGLKHIATKDPSIEGDWDSKFPSFGDERTEQDENADEVEEYENRVGVEHGLETRLHEIETALKKIKENAYGMCEKCSGKIEEEILDINPEAHYCKKCLK